MSALSRSRLRSKAHPDYESFIKLYETSFPIFEQRTTAQQELALKDSRYELVLFKQDDLFVGFVAAWIFEECVYIEHLAVNTQIRGRGFGSQMMQDFICSQDKVVILEIDPVVDEKSKARLRFYQKCGFKLNAYTHCHPPYRKGFKAHSLMILSSDREISSEEYDAFNAHLCKEVMAFEAQ